MASFLVSPGILVKESDLTNVIPTIASSPGATAGQFVWGPVMEPKIVDSANNLVKYFGKPNTASANAFFTSYNFLSYSSNLLLTRAYSKWMFNAHGNTTTDVIGTGTVSVTSGSTTLTGAGGAAFDSSFVGKVLYSGSTVIGQVSSVETGTSLTLTSAATATYSGATYTIGIRAYIANPNDYTNGGKSLTNFGAYIAKYPGSIGSSLAVSMCDSATWLKTGVGTISVANGSTAVTGASSPSFLSNVTVGSYLVVSGTVIGQVSAIGSDTSITLSSAYTGTTLSGSSYQIKWQYADLFEYAPSVSTYGSSLLATDDELHIVVLDENGLISGTVGTVLEVYKGVSKASDAKTVDGMNNYYKDVINNNSEYVWFANHVGGDWGSPAAGNAFDQLVKVSLTSFGNGSDGIGCTDSDLQSAFALYANDMLYDIALVPVGKASTTLANYVIQNIAEVRKDCVVFVSPQNTSTGEPLIGTTSTIANSIKTYADLITSSSYGFIDSGYKYQYDIYNDVYRWVPLNGDIAGLAARTDSTNDPWWSPAGFNRGQIKNVVKLAFNPGQTDRDTLYKARVNPVVQFPGQGVVLYGDKTSLSRPSAFDRINVRRLFIILEKSIATASKYQLFEFNDQFTRGRFRAMIEPFLRDVQGRRGIQQYQIICDTTNNTPQIINTNQFVATIRIQPTYSINFITLNFVATNNTASFTEIGG